MTCPEALVRSFMFSLFYGPGLLHMSVALSYTVATCIVLPAHTMFRVSSAIHLAAMATGDDPEVRGPSRERLVML